MDIFTILTSTLVSGLAVALIAGWFNLRAKKIEFANTYFKLVMERRIAAHEEVENFINAIKVAVLDGDQKPYHLIFSLDGGHPQLYAKIDAVLSKALWLSDEMSEAVREFNLLVFNGAKDGENLVNVGKENYVVVAELRTRLERILVRDMMDLHDVPAFLRRKKHSDSYITI